MSKLACERNIIPFCIWRSGTPKSSDAGADLRCMVELLFSKYKKIKKMFTKLDI